jgi:hypothetical protein
MLAQFIDTDAGESTPLGRAELLKLHGLIFGVAKTAQAIFDSIVVNYQAAMRVAAVAKRRPSAIHSVPYEVRSHVFSCLDACDGHRAARSI